jgi:hypothetical protein
MEGNVVPQAISGGKKIQRRSPDEMGLSGFTEMALHRNPTELSRTKGLGLQGRL